MKSFDDAYGNVIRYDDGGNMTYWFWRGDKTAGLK